MTMQLVRLSDAQPVSAPGHVNAQPVAVFGPSDSEHFTVIYSHYLPHGTALETSLPTETVYIVTAGQITVRADGGEETLGPMDALRLTAGTVRSVINLTNQPASMIVIRATA